MAHLGKRYKRWVRLDYTQEGIPNVRFYPEAFKLRLFGITSNFWQLQRLQGMLLINKTMEAANPRIWTSAFTSPPGINVQAQFEITDSDYWAPAVTRLKIILDIGFRILDLEFGQGSRNFLYDSFSSFNILRVIIKDSDITLNGPGYTCDAALWSEYAP